MGYVYICMKRTDIPNGVLQITDLQPNVSQRNGSIDPPGQTKYINRLQNDTLLWHHQLCQSFLLTLLHYQNQHKAMLLRR